LALPEFLKEYSIAGDYLKEKIIIKIKLSDKSCHRKFVHIDLREYKTALNSMVSAWTPSSFASVIRLCHFTSFVPKVTPNFC